VGANVGSREGITVVSVVVVKTGPAVGKGNDPVVGEAVGSSVLIRASVGATVGLLVAVVGN
jgi:hypothetical protein